MITVITTIRLPKPITRDEARRIFLSTAPKYQGVPGLVRKVYVLSQEGNMKRSPFDGRHEPLQALSTAGRRGRVNRTRRRPAVGNAWCVIA